MPHIRVATFAGPGTEPVIQRVRRPSISSQAALIEIGLCGVCGTDLHILQGHWPKPLPWPFTLGHELAGVIVEKGRDLECDFMGQTLEVGSKVMLPPLMPCGTCYYCLHYPETSNKCLNPVYYGRYLGFEKPPHLWGGWAEMVYVDLATLPGTKIYKLPDDMPLRLGALSEPLTSCIRAFQRASRAGGFHTGDTVVIQGSGPIGVLAVAAAQEMGAGRVIVIGAPQHPRLDLCEKFGAESTVCLEEHPTSATRIETVRKRVGGYGADVVMDCSGHPSAGPEGIEMLRDGNLRRNGTIHRRGSNRNQLAPDLQQGHQCTGKLGFYRKRYSPRNRDAGPRPGSLPLGRHAVLVPTVRNRHPRSNRCGHDNAQREVDNRL